MSDHSRNDIVLSAQHISKSFGLLDVLDDISISVKKNEFITLIGPSGCGKTTLLRILAGLTVTFSGAISSTKRDNELVRAVAFQDARLFPWLTLIDNILICMNNSQLNKKEKKEYALNYLRKAYLQDFAYYYPYEISGGMKQRVNIIRAFVSNSDIVFMDEPFVYLDFLQRIELQKLTLRLLEEEHKTVFFITHNIHEAVTLADRVLVMSRRPGKIIQEFPISFRRPRDVEGIRLEKEYVTLTNTIMKEIKAESSKS